jgi:hypothetical protein
MNLVDGTRRLKGVGLGAGYFAPFQYEAWTRVPEAEIAAIYNRTEERAARIQREYDLAACSRICDG